jgi:hypothetical protein
LNLSEMRSMVRKDLSDTDSGNYRWTDDEIDRHIAHALKELSEAIPLEQKATLATNTGSREISLATLTGLLMIEKVEYPVDMTPPKYQRFALWNGTLTLLGEEVPDGSNCYIYYGKLHTLDGSTSTLSAQFEELLASGACGYAASQMAGYTINRVNVGGTGVPDELLIWGKAKLNFFRSELRRLGKTNRVRARQLYTPYYPLVSKTTDWGP